MWSSIWLTALLSALPLRAGLEIDLSKSELFAFVEPDSKTVLSGLSHEHVLRAVAWTASFSLDPEHPDDCRALFVIPVKSLAVDEPEQRQKLGWKLLDDKDRQKIRSNMLATEQLSADKYPEIRFEANRCRVIDRKINKYFVDGKLTVRGQTRDKGAYVNLVPDGEGARASGELTFRHTQFGFDPYSAALGAIKNADLVRVSFSLTLRAPKRP